MNKCRHFDCGWCYAQAPVDCHVAPGTNQCLGSNICERYRKDGQMDIEVMDAHGASVVIEKTEDKHKSRKERPVYSGLLKYFPDALMEVAHCSWLGQQQHNDPNKPLYWDRSKSADELDAHVRHLMDMEDLLEKDDDGSYHLAKALWRLCAIFQKELENVKEGEA